MFFRDQAIDVYRYVPASGFADPTYVYFYTASGVIQPFTGGDGIRNNQRFADVKDLITLPLGHNLVSSDILRYRNAYHRIEHIEDWDSDIMPHAEIYTTDSQWPSSL